LTSPVQISVLPSSMKMRPFGEKKLVGSLPRAGITLRLPQSATKVAPRWIHRSPRTVMLDELARRSVRPRGTVTVASSSMSVPVRLNP